MSFENETPPEDSGNQDSGQEIIPPEKQQKFAADGSILPSTAFTLGNIMDILEDGQFSDDVAEDVCDLVAALNDMSRDAPGRKHKGKLVVEVDLEMEDGAIKIQAKHKVKKPERPRPKSVFWSDEQNRLTRFPPGQRQMFGVRRATGSGSGVRNV